MSEPANLLQAIERDSHPLDQLVEPLQLLQQYHRGGRHNLTQLLANDVQLEHLWQFGLAGESKWNK